MADLQTLTSRHERGLILASALSAAGDDTRVLRRAGQSGELVRVTRGVYAEAARWGTLAPSERFRLFVDAMVETMRPGTVFSHHAAAAVLGIRCTSPARTIADLARILPFRNAVASADAALHRKRSPQLLTPDQLQRQAERMEESRGSRRIERVVAFATPLSDSVRESDSRVCIHLLGFPAPILQRRFFDRNGLIGETDFWWPKYNLIGECDGVSKYLDRELRRGRTPAQVVVDEKLREDRLRACGPRVVRWTIPEIDEPQRLFRKLIDAGLPVIR